MDPITHAASGAVAMLCLPSRPATRWALPLAALACASPDIDVFFSSTPLGFLEFHRGITHALAPAPLFAFLLALGCYPLWRADCASRWSFPKVWLFCVGMILLHDWLDVVTTYGTMLFLPFSHYRVRLNGIFIIDLLVTLPLLLALWRWRSRRRLMLLILAWTFVYPALGIAINQWHTAQWEQRLTVADEAEGNRPVARKLHVYPDAFAPFFWRVVYLAERDDNPALVYNQSINALGNARAFCDSHMAADQAMISRIADSSTDGEVYFAFAQLPVMQQARAQDLPGSLSPDARVYMFYDLRFASGLEFVRKIMAMRPNADFPFQLLAEFIPQGDPAQLDLARIRLRFSDSGRDSGWHIPNPPHAPSLAQWLVGMN